MKSKLFLLCLFLCGGLAAQITSPTVVIDSLGNNDPIIESEKKVNIEDIETYADMFVPRKASLYSAILPGAGQFYNRKYWKMPLVYGGLVILGSTANFYHEQYDRYRGELFQLLQDNTFIPPQAVVKVS